MKHDMQVTDTLRVADDRPLDIPDGCRSEANALFAPMDRSCAASVVSAVIARRNRRRSFQAFWIGLSPIAALILVVVLYAGSMSSVLVPSRATSGSMVTVPQVGTGVYDMALENRSGDQEAVRKGFAALAAGHPGPVLRIDVENNSVHKGLLIAWLRISHYDVAAQLEDGQTGVPVSLTLDAAEADQFVSLMVLHDFTGQSPSGLVLSIQSSQEAWMSALQMASFTVSLTR